MNPKEFKKLNDELMAKGMSVFDYYKEKKSYSAPAPTEQESQETKSEIAPVKNIEEMASQEQILKPKEITETTPEKQVTTIPVISESASAVNYELPNESLLIISTPVLEKSEIIIETPISEPHDVNNQNGIENKLQITPVPYQKTSSAPNISTTPSEAAVNTTAYDSLKEVFDFFRKRTNIISLDDINKKVKSRLKDRNQSESDIMKNVPLSGIINFELYKLSPETDEIKPEQFARKIRMNLGIICAHQVLGKLNSDYIIENYPLTNNEFRDENGNYYLIEGTISFEKKEAYAELYKTLEERVIKETKETAELLKLERDATIEKINTLKKSLNETRDLEAKNYKVTGYSIRKRSKSNNNSDFANFWQMIKRKVEIIPGISVNLIGKGGAAAKGSNDPSGVYLFCHTPEAVTKIGELLKEKVPAYNSVSKGSVDYSELTDKIDKKQIVPVKTDNVELDELLKKKEQYNSELKALSKKSITYFGSGKEGIAAYLFLKQELEKANINLTGKVTEEDRRTFNLMTSIKNAHPKLFGNLEVGYRDTSMTNMTIDLFYLNKDVFKTMQDVKIGNFVSRLNKNALITLSNGAVSEEEKEKEAKIIAQFHQVLSCRQFKYNKIAENGLTIYHAMEKTNT